MWKALLHGAWTVWSHLSTGKAHSLSSDFRACYYYYFSHDYDYENFVTVTFLLLLSVIIAIITVTVAIIVAEGTAMGPGFLHTTHSHIFRYLALRYLSFWMLSPS